MNEHPIIFQGAMVRALLDGSKTQTRRCIKLPHQNPLGVWEPMTFGGPNGGKTRDGNTIPEKRGIWHTRTGHSLCCPYGQPGDRLWVRETWLQTNPFSQGGMHTYGYRASDEIEFPDAIWKPSIHMPRDASRITLEVTGVRVERLQDISRGDAMAEGCPFPNMARGDDPRKWYADLWSSINGPGSWELNPWVWVVEFKRMKTCP